MQKVLVVGQTPPPYHGQAIMIENMIKAKFKRIKLYHIRMDFSSENDEVGKFRLTKIVKLFAIILKIYYYRIRYDIHHLYYPPAPPKMIPVIRDIVILNATRWLFKSTIFHFHAAGVSEIYDDLKGLIKKLYEEAYFYPDVSIGLSRFNPEDGKCLYSKKELIIPYGIKDEYGETFLRKSAPDKPDVITLLFVGLLCESKGVVKLLESARLLLSRGYRFHLQFIGKFESPEFEKQVVHIVDSYGLTDYVAFLGVKTGYDKFKLFFEADVFCFPTFYEAESFGIVILEAMQFSLPVVATRWRGVPSVVQNNVNGFLVPPKDAQAFANKLEILIKDYRLRGKLGNAGRDIYINNFTEEQYYDQLELSFCTV
ncbi:MAG: glycosyltransferase family 4 protein [Bacteroidota bacterium]